MTDIQYFLKDYDELTYLNLNPDVREAVNNQSFKSGIEHCLTHGIYEDRPGIPESIKDHILKNTYEVLSPPNHLRLRVHGDESLQNFENAGKLLSYNIFSSLIKLAGSNPNNKILDFGCGCGRVIRYLSALSPTNVFYGSDIDHEAISWCKENLSSIGEFTPNDELPPLPFESGFFDFIYSISVFTHLPEEMQFLWLEELKRVTKKDGYLFLTTHGEHLLDASPRLKKKLIKNGFYYSVGNGTDGLPDFYQTSYHTDDYIQTRWGDYFEVIKIIKKGVMNHQDLVICKNSL
ncbi:MAG: class I SAM-dependent methyltransferase [Candidatus Thiodiazotropha sp.]|jgi:SAM-dependent methyltransferase